MDIEVNNFESTDSNFKLLTPPNPHQILRICINLKKLIDTLIPSSTVDTNKLLNSNIIELAFQACGGKGIGEVGSSSRKYRGSIIFCLLILNNWYIKLSQINLHDSSLFLIRSNFTQNLAKSIIDKINLTDEKYLFIQILCFRYSICLNNEIIKPISALELAVDNHSIIVISSVGYQRCIDWLWKGWIIQSRNDPQSYIIYKDSNNTRYLSHFNPNRIKSPKYQNYVEIFLSIIYLILFSYLINNHDKHPNFIEIVFYLFTFSFAMDEVVKFYHIGQKSYFGSFSNCFNDLMYLIILIGLTFKLNSHKTNFNEISYKILSCVAPMMWSRLLFYLDSQKFIGAMIVVIQKMMKESILFFTLLFIIILGFLQGFIGMDSADGKRDKTYQLFHLMIKTIIGGVDFNAFEKLAPPYSGILYYVFVFIITVILLNILGALFNSSYALIVSHAIDEYLALNSAKTLKYIRSPDMDLFIAPFNLVEFLFLTLPLSWWVPKYYFKKINYYFLIILYFPILALIALHETKNAKKIQYNRFKNLPDDANQHDNEWDLKDGFKEEEIFMSENTEEVINNNLNLIEENLQIQRNFENQDPEFLIDIKNFESKINDLSPTIKKSNDLGISWEIYELHDKIDKLTALIEKKS